MKGYNDYAGTTFGETKSKKGAKNMKRYKVYVYNIKNHYHDWYEVNAEDPVDARGIAVQRLINETGEGLNEYEITEIKEVDKND